jgi:cytochrome c556
MLTTTNYRQCRFGLTVLAAAILMTGGILAQAPPMLTIKEVMKEAHKRPKELLRKVVLGKASPADKERLRELYQALAKNSPPKGSDQDWKTTTDLMIASAEAVIANKPDAARQLERAANCKSCHEAHKK